MVQQKFAVARRHRQHARRVRYPRMFARQLSFLVDCDLRARRGQAML